MPTAKVIAAAAAAAIASVAVPTASRAQNDEGRALTGPWRVRVCYSAAMRAKEPRLATMQDKTYDLEFGAQKADGTVEALVRNFPGTLSMIANFQGEDLNVSKFFQGMDAQTTTRTFGRGFLAHDQGRFIGTWKTERGADGQWVVSRTTLPGCDAPEITIVAPTPPRRGREITRTELRRLIAAWWSRQDTAPFEKAASWGDVNRFIPLAEAALKGVQLDAEFLTERFRLHVGSDAANGLTIDTDEYERLRKVGLTQYPVGWLVVDSASGADAELTLTHEAMHMMYFGLNSSIDVDGFDLLNEFTTSFAGRLTNLKTLRDTSLPDMVRSYVRAEFDWAETSQRFKRATELRAEQLEPYTKKPWKTLIDDFFRRTGGRFDLSQMAPIADQLLVDARPKAEADRGTLAVTLDVGATQPAGATLAGRAAVTLTAPAGTDPGRSLVASVQVGNGSPVERRLGVITFAGGRASIDLASFGAKVPATGSATVKVTVRFGAAPEAPASATATVASSTAPPPGGGGGGVKNKPFGRPQYLIHVTKRGTRTGTEDADFYAVHSDKPDAKGNFVAPDGSGGTRGYGSDSHSGPYRTPEEVCAAAAGKVPPDAGIPSFTSSAETVRCG